MKSVMSRVRDHDESIIYEALKETAPVYVAQGEAMTLYAMSLCGMSHEDIVKVHEEFHRVLERRSILGKECRCEDLMDSLEEEYGIDIEDLRVNFPDFAQFVKEWRR